MIRPLGFMYFCNFFIEYVYIHIHIYILCGSVCIVWMYTTSDVYVNTTIVPRFKIARELYVPTDDPTAPNRSRNPKAMAETCSGLLSHRYLRIAAGIKY